MKILYASHKGLPDHRIERAAYIAKKAGHSVEFMGMGTKTNPALDVFDRITMLRSINNRQAALDKKIRVEWREEIETISPDLVHANDIIPGKYTSLTEVPMVYDDHEYWSAQIAQFEMWPTLKRMAIRPFIKAIPEWEREIITEHVTITVSHGIAEAHRKYCKNVFVLQNYCLKEEIENLRPNPEGSGAVFVGADFERKRFAPFRDLTGLKEALEFDVISGLSRDALYTKLTDYRFGLVPFRPHPYHKYANSAKAFDYLAAGLQVLMNRTLWEAHGRMPYTYPFDDYDNLSVVIEKMEKEDTTKQEEVMKHSHEHYVWEAQKDILLQAYETALST